MTNRILSKTFMDKESAKTIYLNSIYVGRPTVWGNPFIIGRDGTRDEVIEKFRKYAIKKNKEDPNWIKPLINKNLVCWCAPRKCHAEILLELASKGDN